MSIAFSITLTLFCLVGPIGAQNATPKYKELPNFHQVNQNLYRGAQPRRSGVNKLAQLGIKTIINLRDDDENARKEEAEARAAGLNYFNFPMDRLGRPSDERVERVLAIINAREYQPVFVHCKRGAERTGTVIAVYRITHDGWSSEAAQREADRYGMFKWRFDLRDYIRDYYKHQSQRSGKPVVRFDATYGAVVPLERVAGKGHSRSSVLNPRSNVSARGTKKSKQGGTT